MWRKVRNDLVYVVIMPAESVAKELLFKTCGKTITGVYRR